MKLKLGKLKWLGEEGFRVGAALEGSSVSKFRSKGCPWCACIESHEGGKVLRDDVWYEWISERKAG